MYRIIRTGLILGSLITVVGVTRVNAQVDEPMKFTAPFAFTVNGKSMPAGTYDLRSMDEQHNVLELTNRAAHRGLFFEVEGVDAGPDAPAARSEVVFLHHGSDYVLRDIWVAGERLGAETMGKLPESMRAARDSGQTSDVRIAALVGSHAARS